jgi:hypothetical protein
LLKNAERTDPYAGDAYQNPRSSIVCARPPSQGEISLYVVEAIRVGLTCPHQTAGLIRADDGNALPMDPTRAAIDAYRAWWAALRKKNLDDVRSAPDPLRGTGLAWWGPGMY